MTICICGGGNLGHVIAGFIASRGEAEVRLLTRQPDLWSGTLAIDTPEGDTLHGRLSRVSASAADVIPEADIVLLCLPGYSIAGVLQAITPYLTPQTAVGSVVSSTGFYFNACRILPQGTPVFGFQRVPFIARTTAYGHRASLLGYKKQLVVGTENVVDTAALAENISRMLHTPVVLAKNMYEVSLTNSNPLLHPARLYTMWCDWREGIIYPRCPMFYEEWTDEASSLYIAMDGELQRLLAALDVTPGSIPDVLTYYESNDAESLTCKLRSIEAFKGISSPMTATAGGFIPDFKSRYFTEDFHYGIEIISRLAAEKGIPVPLINNVCRWGCAIVARG